MPKRTTSKKPVAKRRPRQTLRSVYAESRRHFSADDLQKFTVVEKGIPLAKVIGEMEKIQGTPSPK